MMKKRRVLLMVLCLLLLSVAAGQGCCDDTTSESPANGDTNGNGNGNGDGDNGNTVDQPFTITEVDLVAEMVTIDNAVPESGFADLRGWRLVSTEEGEEFTFPTFTLPCGIPLYLSSGPEAIDDLPITMFWTTDEVWDDGGDPAELYDPEGNLVSTYP